MTHKKWRPFWSYDVEKTESWLTKAAVEGKQLTGLNRKTRMFSFEDDESVESEFQLVFDKTNNEVPSVLAESGWKTKLAEGNWRFIQNNSEEIRTYPSREGILRRNKVHTNVLSIISIFFGLQLLVVLGIFSFFLFSSAEVNFVSSPLWIITIMYFLLIAGVIWLAIHSTRKLRAFEQKHFNISVDEEIVVGKTFVKWKLGWMQSPDLTEKWLSEMASSGNHLIRVQGMRFVFERATPKRVSYVYDYHLKVAPNYFDIHKSAGWHLKYTSGSSFSNHVLWSKEYDLDEEKPLLTNDLMEKKAQARKVLLTNISSLLFTAVITLFVLKLNFSSYADGDWPTYHKVILVALVLSLIIPLTTSVQTFKYALRIRKL